MLPLLWFPSISLNFRRRSSTKSSHTTTVWRSFASAGHASNTTNWPINISVSFFIVSFLFYNFVVETMLFMYLEIWTIALFHNFSCAVIKCPITSISSLTSFVKKCCDCYHDRGIRESPSSGTVSYLFYNFVFNICCI